MAFGSNTSKWYFVGDSSSLEKATKRSEDSLGRLNATGKKAFGQLSDLASGFGLAVGVGGLAVGVGKAIGAASDLGEQINKTAVVFRGSEQQIQAWSETTSKALGISQRAALEAAGTFGNMLVPMGFARDRAAEMSERMVELAADMASFNNADPSEVLEALRSGLAGETEPLRRFGVFLNDARLKQEALSLGLYDGKGALDAQAKAAATYAVILKDTGDAQGDFGRTSDSLANSQRILRAQFEDAAAKLGSALIPAATKLVEVLNGAIPVVEGVVRKIDALVDKLGGWKVAAGFILSGLFASRILAIVEAVKGLTVASAAAGAAQAASAGTALTAWGKLGAFLKVGLPAALAVGLVAMRDKVRDEAPGVVEDIRTNIFGELTDEESKRILEENGVKLATSLSDGMAEKLSKLGPQVFVPAWEDVQRTSKIAALDTGEESGDSFIDGVREKLKAAFPPAVIGALAPTWEDIRKAAEAAGMDVGSAFAGGFQQTAGVTNGQFGPNTLNSYATSQGAQGASVANAVNYALSQQGVPYVWGGGRTGGPDSGAGLPVDRGQQGFDCSGLIYAAYKRAGVTVPGTSQAWLKWPHRVASIGDLMPGDVIVTNGGEHVVMYIGNNMVIAASGGPSGGGNDKVLIQSLDYHKGGIVGMFRPVPGAQVSAGAIDDVVASTVDGSGPRPSIPGSTTSPTSSSTPTPRARTSFPAIAGISDSLQGRFDAANQPEGEALRYDPKTKKWVAVKVGPDMKALKRLADHLRTKVLPGLQKRIDVLKKRIGRLVKKKADGVLIQTLRNKLAALQDERDEIVALWREIIDTWKELKDAAEEDDDTGDEPTAAYDFSGPVGGQPGLPGHENDTATSTPDTTPDMQAQVDQANRRTAAAQRAAQLSGAFVSSLGIGVDANGNATVTAPGAPTIVVQSLQLPNEKWLAELGRHVSMAASGQAFQPSTAESLGV